MADWIDLIYRIFPKLGPSRLFTSTEHTCHFECGGFGRGDGAHPSAADVEDLPVNRHIDGHLRGVPAWEPHCNSS
jgi:hypothetical protein